MKKLLLLLTLFLVFPLSAFADRNGSQQIYLQKKKTHTGHLEQYEPADMPLGVYYDDDTDEIVIIADGFSAYYDVEINDYSTGATVISTQISGYGDSIDVSSLSTGTYTITITTSYNNVFVGQFTI